MSNTIEKTTKEALQMCGRLYGSDVEILGSASALIITAAKIDDVFLKAIRIGFVKEFRITSLRTLDEMTEEEKEELDRIHRTMPLDSRADVYAIKAAQTHYLESIGIDTMGINNKTILIKD